MTALAAWLEATWLHDLMIDNPTAFTAAEALHFMALSVLVGALLVVDLRGLGLFKAMPWLELHKLVPFAIGAFAVNLATGIAFIASNPTHYFEDLSFQLKMGLILVAGLNALVFEFRVFRPLAAGVAGVESRAVTRITSGLSILVWGLVLIFGRLIPYV
jgi:hypothetical protein